MYILIGLAVALIALLIIMWELYTHLGAHRTAKIRKMNTYERSAQMSSTVMMTNILMTLFIAHAIYDIMGVI